VEARARGRPGHVEDYLNLPYHITLVRGEWADGTEGWFAEVDELTGCMSQGRTPEEAIENVRDAMLGWISVALEDGKEIPLPRDPASYSGRFLLRISRTLHADLARAAKHEGVSLNQFTATLLARAIGARDRELV
jgi:antitoxin HicB